MTDTKQAPRVTVKIVRPPNTPVLFVEGISQIVMGFPNCRVALNQYTERSEEGGSRQDVHNIACELVMPTSAMIELAHNILRHVGANKESLHRIGTKWADHTFSAIDALPTAAPERVQLSEKQ